MYRQEKKKQYDKKYEDQNDYVMSIITYSESQARKWVQIRSDKVFLYILLAISEVYSKNLYVIDSNLELRAVFIFDDDWLVNWNRIESNWKTVCVYNNKNNNYVSIYCIWVGLDNSNGTQK